VQDLFPVQVRYEAGHLDPSGRPGLEIVFDESAAVRYPSFKDGACPQYRRGDGSFTNW